MNQCGLEELFSAYIFYLGIHFGRMVHYLSNLHRVFRCNYICLFKHADCLTPIGPPSSQTRLRFPLHHVLYHRCMLAFSKLLLLVNAFELRKVEIFCKINFD
jgi:hypothetical protein